MPRGQPCRTPVRHCRTLYGTSGAQGSYHQHSVGPAYNRSYRGRSGWSSGRDSRAVRIAGRLISLNALEASRLNAARGAGACTSKAAWIIHCTISVPPRVPTANWWGPTDSASTSRRSCSRQIEARRTRTVPYPIGRTGSWNPGAVRRRATVSGSFFISATRVEEVR